MKLTLEWEFDGLPQTFVLANKQPIRIGRSPRCDILLPSATIPDEQALITVENGRFHLQNTRSQNTISINKVTSLAYGQKVALKEGDEITIGDLTLKVTTVERTDPLLQVQCATCAKIVDGQLVFCPWCGTLNAVSQIVH